MIDRNEWFLITALAIGFTIVWPDAGYHLGVGLTLLGVCDTLLRATITKKVTALAVILGVMAVYFYTTTAMPAVLYRMSFPSYNPFGP